MEVAESVEDAQSKGGRAEQAQKKTPEVSGKRRKPLCARDISGTRNHY